MFDQFPKENRTDDYTCRSWVTPEDGSSATLRLSAAVKLQRRRRRKKDNKEEPQRNTGHSSQDTCYSIPSPVHVNPEMSESPDARSLLSASSQLNLMEVDAVRHLYLLITLLSWRVFSLQYTWRCDAAQRLLQTLTSCLDT